MKELITGCILAPDEPDARGNTVSVDEIRAAYDAFREAEQDARKPGEMRIVDSHLTREGAWIVTVEPRCPLCKRTDGWRALLFWRWWHRLRCPTYKAWKAIKAGKQVGLGLRGGREK